MELRITLSLGGHAQCLTRSYGVWPALCGDTRERQRGYYLRWRQWLTGGTRATRRDGPGTMPRYRGHRPCAKIGPRGTRHSSPRLSTDYRCRKVRGTLPLPSHKRQNRFAFCFGRKEDWGVVNV